MSMTIFDVLSNGPIVACDEELGLLVTINGSYLNLWASRRDGWENVECQSGHPDLYTLTAARAIDLGEEWLAEIRKGDDAEEGDDEADDEEEEEEEEADCDPFLDGRGEP